MTKRTETTLCIGLALLLVVLRLPSLEEPFDNDSGANAYHARLIVQGAPLYSSHHPIHHLPGVYYTYALAFRLFGDRAWSVKFLLIPWNLVAMFGIYCLGKRLGGKGRAWMAALFFAILVSDPWLKGNTAESELFANLPRLAGILLVLRAMELNKRGWTLFFSGACCAMAFLYKAVFLSPLAVAILLLAAEAWLERRETRSFLRQAAWLSAGFLVPILLAAAYFAVLGLLPNLLMVFTSGQKYVNLLTTTRPVTSILFSPLIVLLLSNAGTLILAVIGVGVQISALVQQGFHTRQAKIIHSDRQDEQNQRTSAFIRLGIVAWFLLSIIEAGITRNPFPHYSLVIVPSLALLAAEGISAIQQKLNAFTQGRKRPLHIPFTLIVLALLLGTSALQNHKIVWEYTRYRLGWQSYSDFVGRYPFLGAIHLRTLAISQYLHEKTSPQERIFIWSDDAQIYYMADRQSPIDVVWPVYAHVTGPYQRIFVPQTKYIVVGKSLTIGNPEWLQAELEKSYTLETILYDNFIYRRAARNYSLILKPPVRCHPRIICKNTRILSPRRPNSCIRAKAAKLLHSWTVCIAQCLPV